MDTKVVNNRIILFGIMLILISISVLADQTQLFSKIYLNPYYLQSTTSGTAYNYTLTVNPPDGLTHVYSATITFQAYLSPSVNFTLLVNNRSCNNPNYYVSTTYATAGQGVASFDCSNIINKSGNYTLQLRMDKNTGAINGWLDLTYTNRPLPTMDVFGTEYQAGDDGTIFLLLKDANGVPIENATCILDIYLPLSANSTHDEWINDGLMMYLEEGLYYYDFIAPLYAGVYMVNAKCTYVTSGNQYYPLSLGYGPTRNVTTGIYTGDTFVLNDFAEWLYTQCDSGTAGGGNKACDSWYQWNLTAGGLTGNVTQLFVQYLGECNGANPMIQYWWNWSNSQWVKLPNNITFSATASSGVPIGVDEYLSNSVPLAAISNTTLVRIRTQTTSGSTFKLWSNMLILKAVQYGTTIQDLKGSGEIHVTSTATGENKYFVVDTCDGYVDGRCGIFTNDTEFDLVEGEIEDYLNISASSTRTDLPIHYETPFGVDCTALYWIKEWNGTDWVDFTDYNTYSQPSFQNCIITLYKNVTSGTKYAWWFKMDNYMKWEVEYTKQIEESMKVLIEPLCADRNFTYVNPITDNSSIPNDTITEFCYRAYDDFYWIDTYYNDSVGVNNAGEYASFLQEMRFYRQELFNRYNTLQMNQYFPTIIAKLDSIQNMTALNFTLINQQLQNLTNITITNQGILNQIWNYLTNVIYPFLVEMKDEVSYIENITTYINQTTTQTNQTVNYINQTMIEMNQTITYINETNSWILQMLNISTQDLNLIVTAPVKCLVDTNWLAKAQVKDRYGNILSYLDGIQCNMTTDLWGTFNMSYEWVNQSFKYIHVCDPANTTFNWTVDCVRN